MTTNIKADENLTCDACGRFGAFDFDGEHLCAECYAERGSCCVEFGGKDLWRQREQPASGVHAPNADNAAGA